MTALFGHAWVSAHGIAATNPDGRLTIDGETWQRALVGISGPQLAAGLDACITEAGEFPPSAPRFRAMCLGIPSFARVRIEITKAESSRSPFTRHVWQYVDGYAYRQATIRDGERMLRSAYDLAVETRMQGAELPKAPEFALAQDDTTPPPKRTRAVAEAAMAEIEYELATPGQVLSEQAARKQQDRLNEALGITTTAAERAQAEADLQAHYSAALEDQP